MSSPKILGQSETQIASSRIWTRVADCISCERKSNLWPLESTTLKNISILTTLSLPAQSGESTFGIPIRYIVLLSLISFTVSSLWLRPCARSHLKKRPCAILACKVGRSTNTHSLPFSTAISTFGNLEVTGRHAWIVGDRGWLSCRPVLENWKY